MNLSRLLVLGTLAASGPMHGHQIRRRAEITNVGEWGGVSVGALYRELRTMEAEGLVEPIRTERMGHRPARTVYSITGEGRLELANLREQAIRAIPMGPDPMGVALQFAGIGPGKPEVEIALRHRRQQIAAGLEAVRCKRTHLLAQGYLNSLQGMVLRRAELHIQAELEWQEELDKVLADLAPDASTEAPDGDD
jgi:DNA-binding PadR family transcriptional regulator